MKKLLISSLILTLMGCDGGSSLNNASVSPAAAAAPIIDDSTQISVIPLVTNTSTNIRNIELSLFGELEEVSFTLCAFNTSLENDCEFIKQGNAINTPITLQLGTEVTLEQLLNNEVFFLFEGAIESGTNNIVYLNTPLSEINKLIQYIKPSNTNGRDKFGSGVAISKDGKTLAVGAMLQDSATDDLESTLLSNFSGAVYVFNDSDTGWQQTSFLKHPYTDNDDAFGSLISMNADGTVLAISAPEDDSDSQAMLEKEAANPRVSSSTETVSITTESTNTQITKTIRAVTAPETNTDADPDPTETTGDINSGSILIYTKTDDEWSFQTLIKSNVRSPNMKFGLNSMVLSADGKTLAVGHYSGVENSADPKNERVEIFVDENGTWTHLQTIQSQTPIEEDFFGFSIALSEDASVLAVSATLEDSAIVNNFADNSRTNAGSVYIFNKVGDAYTFVKYLKPNTPTINEEFGSFIDLSANGEILAVGAQGSNKTYLFDSNSNAWVYRYTVTSSRIELTDTENKFGHHLALNNSGSKLMVGSLESNLADGINDDTVNSGLGSAGSVHVFDLTSSGYEEKFYLKPIDTDLFDLFSHSMATNEDGSILTVGAPGESSSAIGVNNDASNNSFLEAGAVYIYYF